MLWSKPSGKKKIKLGRGVPKSNYIHYSIRNAGSFISDIAHLPRPFQVWVMPHSQSSQQVLGFQGVLMHCLVSKLKLLSEE